MSDRDLAAQADAAFRATTTTYATWQKNVRAGKYPALGPPSQFGIGFGLLAQIGQTPPPVDPPVTMPTLTVTTPSQLRAALAQVAGADQLVKVTGTYPGQYDITRDFQGATFDFAAARFTGGAWTAGIYACAHITRCKNAELLNLDCSSGDTGGQGILVNGLVDNVRITGKTHRCGGQGISVQAPAGTGPNTRLDVDVESWDNGYNLAIDNHKVLGDGLHAAYVGGGFDYGYTSSGKFVFHVHDQPHGSGVQIGQNCVDSTFDIRAERITGTWQDASGNAVNIWGYNRNVTVRLVADGCVRHAVQTSGIYKPQTGVSVPYARATNIGDVEYTNVQGDVVYGDVA